MAGDRGLMLAVWALIALVTILVVEVAWLAARLFG